MSESCKEADILDPSDRPGPECREAFGGSVIATGWDDRASAIGPARPSRPSADRKRARSIRRVFGSIGGGCVRDFEVAPIHSTGGSNCSTISRRTSKRQGQDGNHRHAPREARGDV